MSFGGFGFGAQNNQNPGFGTGTGFGGSSSGGFGSTPTTSPFGGGGNTGGSLFGNTSNSFGSGGGFGSSNQNQQNTLFGNQNRTGFGTGGTAGGSLFGGGTSTGGGGGGFGGFGSGGGGFGSTAGAGNASGTGGGLFSKPAGGFGGSTGTGGGFGTGGGGFGGGAGFGGAGTAFQQSVPPSDGTGNTPFNPVTEKDSAASSVTNHYQSISYMQPYNKYSFEELRLGDYNQGRRFGNGSGQAGAFGTSAFGSTGGFGQPASGFGSTSTPFGGGTSAPTGFGQTQTAGGFGSTSSNPLFGASKPANSLFGGTSGTSQPSAFGGTAPTSGGFGSSTGTGGFGSGGSLFGNNQQQQNKPLFGSTGGTGTTGGTGFGGFGQQTTSAPNPFGGTTGTASPFGGQQQTGTGLGGFGQQNQAQAQPQTQNKGLFGGGFGANTQQQQGGGLFGGGTAGSSLFGQNNQQQQQQPSGGSLFGGANQQTGTSSLFGGGTQQQGQKSLFGGGATGTATGTGGGLFGNTQNQQTGTSSLFGGAQNQQQQKPSLFGGSTGTGGSLFGGQPSAPQSTGPSLFGNPPPQQQQQQQAGGFGTSGLFGNTQQPPPQAQQQPQQPAPGSFQASIMDPNPYGSQSIFSGLPALSGPSPGPLATPLSSAAKQKQSQRTPLPIHKMTPSASNRLSTPPKRPGYGFSYSTYGTPTSSTGTPTGFGGSLLGSSMRGSLNGSLGRSFSKSYSTSSLRNAFDPDAESVLSPGALSGPSRLSSGNIKRLTIDRSLRNNLFSGSPSSTPPAPITNGEDSTQQSDKSKKKVSFDATSTNGVNGASGEVVPVESKTPEPTPEELGFLRSIRNDSANGVNGGTPEVTASARPEMESVQGLEAKDVETTPTAHGLTRLPFSPPGADPQPGEYWMKPTRAEISRMTREEQKHVVDFTVGRQNCGRVTFGGAVDLTTVNLDLVFGGIVDIALRRITVYPDESVKPPLGKGLNVPSTLRIENSWPRGRDKRSPTPLTSGPLFEKHVDRLVKVHNTEFIDYELQTGTWVFKVPHFTTYGLDYDSDEEGESRNQGTMAAPDTPKAHPTNFDQSVGSELSAFSTEDSFVGSTAGVDDDTFDFKKRKIVPGSFGNQEMEMAEREESFDSVEDGSFLEEGSTGSTTEQDNTTESQQSEVGLDEDAEMDMAGSFPTPRRTVERDDTPTDRDESKPWNTPAKARLDLSGDWTDQLERTISPRKQDRAALREIQANAFSERHLHGDTEKPADAPKGFTTSIDLMNSLFHQPRKQQVQPKGFEWPYTKRPKTFADKPGELTQEDVSFHHSFKPRWGPGEILICGKNDLWEEPPGQGIWDAGTAITQDARDIALLAFNKAVEPRILYDAQLEQTSVEAVDGVPFAHLALADFDRFANLPTTAEQPMEETLIWHIGNILFNDDIEDDISAGVPPQLRAQFAHRIKKDRLSRLWETIIRETHKHDLDKIDSPEESAVHLLCAHRVEEACRVLNQSRNHHLATMVAQIGRDPTVQEDMANQVEAWRQSNVYSEMTEPVRALYELLAGNALRSEGRLGGALEDRVSIFSLTDRFDLDWFQAFGLRLWYSITEDEPIEEAVVKFFEDLANGGEAAFPHSPYAGKDRGVLQTGDTTGRESPLWVLLKLYSVTLGGKSAALPAPELPASLLPESVSGGRLTSRLSFQLLQALSAAVGQYDCFRVDTAQADQLVWDLAWEITASGAWDLAVFVLLHLSRAVDRERAVKETLARFAPRLPHPSALDGLPDEKWCFLTSRLKLPESWIWAAKALYARDTGNAQDEVGCLINGKHWNDAHATFCRVVGPTAVIERDYDTLNALILGFGQAPDRIVRGWASGGGMYKDFVHLATTKGRRDPQALVRLINALIAMEDRINKGSGVEGLEERVAFKEMSQAAAIWAAYDTNAVEPSTVLNLPLTGDARVIQTAEMSRRYYNVIMAGAY